MSRLEQVDREIMLRSVHRLMGKRYGTVPLWAFVSDVCAVGSNSGSVICCELGWNPDAECKAPLPKQKDKGN